MEVQEFVMHGKEAYNSQRVKESSIGVHKLCDRFALSALVPVTPGVKDSKREVLMPIKLYDGINLYEMIPVPLLRKKHHTDTMGKNYTRHTSCCKVAS